MKEITAIFVPVDRLEPTEVRTINDFTQIQGVVAGTFDVVRSEVFHGDEIVDISVYVNDEGLIWHLPVNTRACELTGQMLVGPALVTGGVDPEGNTLSAPDWLQLRIDIINNRSLKIYIDSQTDSPTKETPQ